MTIKQLFWWRDITTTVRNISSKCVTCQTTKQNHNSKYGHLPDKEAESKPWDKLCVNLIGLYKFKQPDSKKDVELWCATMIDPATGWIEIAKIPDKQADTVADVIKSTWFNCYLRPTQVVMDRGSEFMAEFSEMVIRDYGIKKKTITTCNPQANAIVERVHQTTKTEIKKNPSRESFLRHASQSGQQFIPQLNIHPCNWCLVVTQYSVSLTKPTGN